MALTDILDKILGFDKKLKGLKDSLFERLLETEFQQELEFIEELSQIPSHERNLLQNAVWNMMKEKYPFNGKCHSVLYDSVSKQLRRRYNIIHRRIIELLY